MLTFLASSFDPLWALGAWAVLMLISVASLIPSARAHWSGPLLALPALLCNLRLDRSIAAGQGVGDPTPLQWLIFFAPMILSAASIGVWIWLAQRRRTRRRSGD
jgi:hypothetical protein